MDMRMRAKVMNAQATKARFSILGYLIHVWNPPSEEKLLHSMEEDHGCFAPFYSLAFLTPALWTKGKQRGSSLIKHDALPCTRQIDWKGNEK